MSFVRVLHYPDAVSAHDGMLKRLFMGNTPDVHYDWAHGFETGLHDVSLACDSFAWDYSLKKLWIPRSRWNMMVRQYINPEDLEYALNMIGSRLHTRGSAKSRGIAVMRTNKVTPRVSAGKTRRRWGSCMLSLSFRVNPYPTITLTSRTSYFGYLAALDINVAHVFARMIGDLIGIEPEEMRFVWSLHLAQFHGSRSIAWVLGQPKYHQLLDRELPNRFNWSYKLEPGNRPGLRKALDGYEKIVKADRAGLLYGDEKYAASSRVRRRFHTEVMGLPYAAQFVGGTSTAASGSRCKAFDPLPEVWCHELDFSVLSRVGLSDGGDDWDDEDDDE